MDVGKRGIAEEGDDSIHYYQGSPRLQEILDVGGGSPSDKLTVPIVAMVPDWRENTPDLKKRFPFCWTMILPDSLRVAPALK